mmetsp:Transcript_107735/g.347803  ORF Transcript_107735/g.347803 Transcript_107735/m.347803 type:complete len:600 (+) Transcript_107735:66-1865(+)
MVSGRPLLRGGGLLLIDMLEPKATASSCSPGLSPPAPLLRGAGAVLAAALVSALALFVGALKGPANPVSLELVDFMDRLLDRAQGGLEYNLGESRYFQGIFAPAREELPDGEGLQLQLVEGELPWDLDGLFLRIGPNPWAEPTKRHHVFDGDGMLHSIRFKNGSAFYHNAYLRTPRLDFEQGRGRAYFTRIGELHGPLGLVKALTVFTRKPTLAGLPDLQAGQANTAVAALPDGRLWALHEGSLPFEFRVTEQGGLASVGYETARGGLDYSVSAHPKVDVRTGEVIFHGYSPAGGTDGRTFLKFGRFDAQGELRSFFGLNATGASFSHDMLLSEHYAVVLDSSVRFSPEKVVSGGSPFSFDASHRARMAVIPRNSTTAAAVQWFEAPEGMAWVHPLHAWEEDAGRTLVLWAPLGFASTRTGSVLDGCCDLWYMGELRLDLQTGRLEGPKLVDPEGKSHGEFSRVRDDLVGSGFARFGYTSLANATSGEDFDFIGYTKWDMLEKKAAAQILHPAGWVVGEPVFIPRAAASGEPSDDGFLGSFLYGPGEESTDFVLHDARSFSQKPVARLRVPKRVPVGFHGAWLGAAGLRAHLAREAGGQ